MALEFFGIEVGGGRAVFYFALTIHVTGGEEHRFGQRGLAFTAVAKQGDIADVFSLIVSHMLVPPINELFIDT